MKGGFSSKRHSLRKIPVSLNKIEINVHLKFMYIKAVNFVLIVSADFKAFKDFIFLFLFLFQWLYIFYLKKETSMKINIFRFQILSNNVRLASSAFVHNGKIITPK